MNVLRNVGAGELTSRVELDALPQLHGELFVVWRKLPALRERGHGLDVIVVVHRRSCTW